MYSSATYMYMCACNSLNALAVFMIRIVLPNMIRAISTVSILITIHETLTKTLVVCKHLKRRPLSVLICRVVSKQGSGSHFLGSAPHYPVVGSTVCCHSTSRRAIM